MLFYCPSFLFSHLEVISHCAFYLHFSNDSGIVLSIFLCAFDHLSFLLREGLGSMLKLDYRARKTSSLLSSFHGVRGVRQTARGEDTIGLMYM